MTAVAPRTSASEEPLPAPSAVLYGIPADEGDFEQAVEAGLGTQRDLASQAVRWLPAPADRADLMGPLRVQYTMDVELSRKVFKVLRKGRVAQGHVILLDPGTGRVLAYASTDPSGFPATRPYPAASLVKVVTAAAALQLDPDEARRPCRYRGNPYRLYRSSIHRPSTGLEISLERALGTSNNHCFAHLAVDTVGGPALLSHFATFGLLEAPAPGHAPGVARLSGDDYDLGRLGSGLAGARITPVHAAQLAATLADGLLIEPWWVDDVEDGAGHRLTLPYRRVDRRVLSTRLARELREMLVYTTTRGTATSAFRDRRHRPTLGSIQVAGKTGNLSGTEPRGRYEWFIGVAPADAPSIAVAVVQVQGQLWWRKSSEIASDVLKEVFCEGRSCSSELAARFTGSLGSRAAPAFLNARQD